MRLSYCLTCGAVAGVHMATGFYFSGRCYPTINDAGDALAISQSQVLSGYSVPSSTYHVRWTHTLACSRTASTTSTATIQCTSLVNGSTSTSAAGAQTVFQQVQTGMGGFATSFPSCDVAETETNQIGAVNIVFGVLLGALAVIWGARKLYSLLSTNARE